MKILLLSSSYNSLTQHAHVELLQRGHNVAIQLAISNQDIKTKVNAFQPDLILCPMLTHIVEESIWRKFKCIIIHPGIKGDRGASSLDWAILERKKYWGVTAVEAADEVDSGSIWASETFPMRAASKSSIYRDELMVAAIKVIITTVKRFEHSSFVPEPLDYSQADVNGRFRPVIKQQQRQLNWFEDKAETIINKVHSADGSPGLLTTLFDEQYYLYGAHREGVLVGAPGVIIAKRHGALCFGATDGAVWITHMKKKCDERSLKLPAATVLKENVADISESKIDLLFDKPTATYKEIWYRESNKVAYLYFEFYNGAMSTEQCHRLLAAYQEIEKREHISVIVLMGGRDYWSNGIHLNHIEAAENPAEESWRNINAINDFVKAVINTSNKYVISALHGSAGAGGVMMALAADKVIIRENAILNPHYKSMGGLYGSEYWTYLLPKRVGASMAEKLVSDCLPVSAQIAKDIHLVDGVIFQDQSFTSTFHQQINRIAEKIASSQELPSMLDKKASQRVSDEQIKPIEDYRLAELEQMKANFFGQDKSYHLARQRFVYKEKLAELPFYLKEQGNFDD